MSLFLKVHFALDFALISALAASRFPLPSLFVFIMNTKLMAVAETDNGGCE